MKKIMGRIVAFTLIFISIFTLNLNGQISNGFYVEPVCLEMNTNKSEFMLLENSGIEQNMFRLDFIYDRSINEKSLFPFIGYTYDLSNIRINVYLSYMIEFDNAGMATFIHSFAFTVYSNIFGIVEFKRPSDHFLIIVDLQTIPLNTGVNMQTVFFHPEQIYEYITISNVTNIILENDVFAQDGMRITPFNKNGNVLNVHYFILDETIYVDNRLTNNEQIYNEMQEEITAFSNIPWNRQYPVNPTNDDYFVIRYTGTSSQGWVRHMMAALNYVKSILINLDHIGFELPRTETLPNGNPRYYIYVVEPGLFRAMMRPLSGGRSYMRFNGISSGYALINDRIRAGIAHEFMHSIMHNIRDEAELDYWFQEGLAEWASVRIWGAHTSETASYVNAFLATTNLPFNTYLPPPNTGILRARASGTLLLQLYIWQNYGGDATIARIVRNTMWTTNSFAAITHGLPGTYTFNSIFPGFGQANYTPNLSYIHADSWGRWDDAPVIAYHFPFGMMPNNHWFNVNRLSHTYVNFAVPTMEGPNYRLDITINVGADFPGDVCARLMMTSDRTGVVHHFPMDMESGTLITRSFISTPGRYSLGAVMVTNTNTHFENGFHLTIRRDFYPFTPKEPPRPMRNVRFNFEGQTVVVPVVEGGVIEAGNIPEPSIRYGTSFFDNGDVHVGWFLVPEPVLLVGAADRDFAVDLGLPVTAGMFGNDGVLDLFSARLMFGDTNGNGRFTHADLLNVQARMLGQTVDMYDASANVVVDFHWHGAPMITHGDLVMMQSRLLGSAVVFGQRP